MSEHAHHDKQQHTLCPLFTGEALAAADNNSPNVDVVVVGAGVGGLHAAFQLALQALSVAVIDCLPFAGGQCVQLYAEKPIYDIPGTPHCTGQSLTDSLLLQLQSLDVRWALATLVQSVERDEAVLAQAATPGAEGGHGFIVRTGSGVVRCRALVLATGVGAFVPRLPKIDGLHNLPAGVLHTDVSTVLVQHTPRVAVLGGDGAAVQAALHLASSGAVPQLVFRRSSPRAGGGLLQQWDALCEQGRASYMQGVPQAIQMAQRVQTVQGIQTAATAEQQATASWLLQVQHADNPVQQVEVDALLLAGGRMPQARNLLQSKQLLEGKHIAANPTTCATAEAGVYAVGDVAQYAHKNRLIVTAFHEATQTAHAIYRYLYPQKPRPLEYTTSSKRLQKLLQVEKTA